MKEAKPFFKWAGGKGQIIETIKKHFPQKLVEGNVKRYVEPFLGGGALFFYLNSSFEIKEFVLNDINVECILTYKVVKDKAEELVKILSELEDKYLGSSDEDREKLYYERREVFNIEKAEVDYVNYSDKWVSHAANMIFLNKTCFNGLYRQNRNGQFNVPTGKYKNPKICNRENLFNVSEALKNTTLLSMDFEGLTDYIDKDTFVYMDPPYRPLNLTSNFSEYSKEPFNDESQIRLGRWFKLLDEEKGALLMLSNSDPTNINADDDFFDKLYDKYNINRISAIRAINSKSNKRGAIRELLITNY